MSALETHLRILGGHEFLLDVDPIKTIGLCCQKAFHTSILSSLYVIFMPIRGFSKNYLKVALTKNVMMMEL